MKEIKLVIDGMKCEGCVNRIKNAISGIKGVEDITLSLENKELTFTVKKDKLVQEVMEKIENLGFQVSDEANMI